MTVADVCEYTMSKQSETCDGKPSNSHQQKAAWRGAARTLDGRKHGVGGPAVSPPSALLKLVACCNYTHASEARPFYQQFHTSPFPFPPFWFPPINP
jgi:hypothetical protein